MCMWVHHFKCLGPLQLRRKLYILAFKNKTDNPLSLYIKYIGVRIRKCSWLCFGYVKEFLMLIREMVFVFHKSTQSLTRVTSKKLSKTINYTDVSF